MSDESVPEADRLDQQRPADPSDEEEETLLRELQWERARVREAEAAEADVLEQAEPVGLDEEER
jgi:hypothetical protein